MKFGFVICCFLFLTSAAQAQGSVDCQREQEKMNAQVIDWDYETFEEKGWRTLASKKCFFAAGSSIIKWLSTHQAVATDAQIQTLRYHAARVFAMTGRSPVALVHLNHARNPEQAADASQDWNSYIDAFSAFLRRDLTDLRASIEKLQQQAEDETGQKPNLIAAKRFLICYSRPYSSIENDPMCIEQTEVPAPSLRRSPDTLATSSQQ